MGGSRADGTVDMAYDFQQFEQPIINHQQAQAVAKTKCAVWGYSGAEPFGGQTTKCSRVDGWGNCVAGQVVIQYQCLGEGTNNSSSYTLTPAKTSVIPSDTSSIEPTKEQWKQQQLQNLMQDSSLGYEEYMKRRAAILAQ